MMGFILAVPRHNHQAIYAYLNESGIKLNGVRNFKEWRLASAI
jgi:hypothetical protein